MEERVAAIKAKMDEFCKEAAKITNKSAARRARMLSMTIRKMLKAYKADSIK